MRVCWSFFEKRAFQRIGPNITQRFDWGIDGCVSLMFDAQRRVPGNPADFAGSDAVLSRNCSKRGKLCRRDADDATGTAFTEELGFCLASARD
jgi:hypothetical protein